MKRRIERTRVLIFFGSVSLSSFPPVQSFLSVKGSRRIPWLESPSNRRHRRNHNKEESKRSSFNRETFFLLHQRINHGLAPFARPIPLTTDCLTMEFSRGNQCPRLSNPLSLLNDNLYRITSTLPSFRIIEQITQILFPCFSKSVSAVNSPTRNPAVAILSLLPVSKNSGCNKLVNKSQLDSLINFWNLSSNLQVILPVKQTNLSLMNKKKESKEKYTCILFGQNVFCFSCWM